MSFHAKGTFVIDSWENPVSPPTDDGYEHTLAVFHRTYSGDFTGTARGESATSRSSPKSAGLVGIELAEGTLHGRTGGFSLVHRSRSGDTVPWLRWDIQSGKGELAGITGHAEIVMNDDEHSYVFDYDFVDPATLEEPEEDAEEVKPKRHFWQRRG